MDEIRGTDSEPNGVSGIEVVVPAAQLSVLPEVENTVPATDSVPVSEEQSAFTQQKEIPIVKSSGGVSVGDTWTNEQTSFRVDGVTPVGGVHIRFRTQDAVSGSKSSFIRQVRALFEKKESAPNGEWFFGSGEEIRQFIEQNGYRLEKRQEEKTGSVKAA